MKIKGNIIYTPFGITITYDTYEKENGRGFFFEDINPSVSFTNVYTKRERLLLAWFFFKSVFATNKEKQEIKP